MGRGINSGSIRIQPVNARKQTKFPRVDPRRGRQPIHYRSQVERIERALCRESPLHEKRDADDGRTTSLGGRRRGKDETLYIRGTDKSKSRDAELSRTHKGTPANGGAAGSTLARQNKRVSKEGFGISDGITSCLLQVVATEAGRPPGVREGESHATNDTTRMWWLGRSEAGCRSVRGRVRAPAARV